MIIPVWAEHELQNIVTDLAQQTLTPETARSLRSRLVHSGLSGLLPYALLELAKEAEE